MKDLLTTMFTGWCIRENSYNRETQTYEKSPEDAMLEACNGDEHKAYLLYLFSEWSNDIQSVAAFYGIGLIRENDKLIIRTVPPMPDDGKQYYWDCEAPGEWIEITPDDDMKIEQVL